MVRVVLRRIGVFASTVVVASIVLHGISVTPLMGRYRGASEA